MTIEQDVATLKAQVSAIHQKLVVAGMWADKHVALAVIIAAAIGITVGHFI